jgi:hypothetical protein
VGIARSRSDVGRVDLAEARRTQAGIAHPTKNHERAHLEAAREPSHLRKKIRGLIVVVQEDLERNEQLRGDLIAPTFDAIVQDLARLCGGDCRLSEPGVRMARTRMSVTQSLAGSGECYDLTRV